MAMTLMTGLIYGVLGTTIFFIVLIGIIFLIKIMSDTKYKYFIKITNITGGKETIEYYYGTKLNHPEHGDVYYVPKLKKEKRHYIPYTSSKYEYPVAGRKNIYVPLVFDTNVYHPETMDAFEEREIEKIIKSINPETKKAEFKKIKQKIREYITKPVKLSMRSWVLRNDSIIKDEYQLVPSWWEKHGHLVLSAAIIGFTVIVCVMMIIFSYQLSQDLLSNQAPAWVQNVLQSVDANVAPPLNTP
jgi:hypothetical protein